MTRRGKLGASEPLRDKRPGALGEAGGQDAQRRPARADQGEQREEREHPYRQAEHEGTGGAETEAGGCGAGADRVVVHRSSFH